MSFRAVPLTLTIITALAFALRLIFIFQWQDTAYAGPPYLDAAAYEDWANAILGGQWLSERAFYQSPLFPYVLALLYAVTGHSFFHVAIFNAVLGSLSCGALAYAAHRAFGMRAMVLTGLLAACYAPSLFYTAPVLKETLGLFVLSLYLLFSVLALETGKRRHYVWAGIFLGLAVLTRGNAVFLLAALPVLLWLRKTPDAKKLGAAHLLATCLAIAPATLHNAVVSHDFVPITYSNGFNFFIGNRVGANGGNAYPSDIQTDQSEENATTKIAESMKGRELKPSEVSAYWFGKGVDFFFIYPMHAAVLWLQKTALFFSDTEFSDNYNISFFRQEMKSMLSWPVFPGFALLLALSVFGYIAATPERRKTMQMFLVPAFFYLASVLCFYVTDRYRLPVIVFLLPLAGAATLPVFANIKRVVAAALIALLVYTASVYYPPRNPLYTMAGWLALGSMQLKRNDDSQAVESLMRAIAMAPKVVESYWYVQAALAADRSGDHVKALEIIEAARRHHPEDEALIEKHYGPLKR